MVIVDLAITGPSMSECLFLSPRLIRSVI
jgi:hypothetical protein